MTPLERAAKALADNHLLVSDGHYTEAARAVLRAIRVPSREMLAAARGGAPSDAGPGLLTSGDFLQSVIWAAMLDAALDEDEFIAIPRLTD